MYKRWKKCGNTIVFARALSIVHRRDELRGVAMGYVDFLVAGVLWKAHRPNLPKSPEPVWRGHCPLCKRRFKLLGLYVYSALDESKPWSKPFLKHSTQLCKRSIPKRFHYLFDMLGAKTPKLSASDTLVYLKKMMEHCSRMIKEVLYSAIIRTSKI